MQVQFLYNPVTWVNEAVHELLLCARFEEVHIHAHFPHLGDGLLPQCFVCRPPSPNEAGHELRLVARFGELCIRAHLPQLRSGVLYQRQVGRLLRIAIAGRGRGAEAGRGGGGGGGQEEAEGGRGGWPWLSGRHRRSWW